MPSDTSPSPTNSDSTSTSSPTLPTPHLPTDSSAFSRRDSSGQEGPQADVTIVSPTMDAPPPDSLHHQFLEHRLAKVMNTSSPSMPSHEDLASSLSSDPFTPPRSRPTMDGAPQTPPQLVPSISVESLDTDAESAQTPQSHLKSKSSTYVPRIVTTPTRNLTKRAEMDYQMMPPPPVPFRASDNVPNSKVPERNSFSRSSLSGGLNIRGLSLPSESRPGRRGSVSTSSEPEEEAKGGRGFEDQTARLGFQSDTGLDNANVGEEGNDSLSDLTGPLPSPRRAAWKAALQSPIPGSSFGQNSLSPYIPSSPAWKSMESYPSSPYPSYYNPDPTAPSPGRNNLTSSSPLNPNSSLTGSSKRDFSQGLQSPLSSRFNNPSYSHSTNSLSGPSPSGISGNFDPTPNHGLHARNLSLYFPQPGQAQRGGEPVSDNLELAGAEDNREGSLIPTPSDGVAHGRKMFAGQGGWTFRSQLGDETGLGAGLGAGLGEEMKKGKRRGHHHKHSLSHNFFSFLDPTQTNPNLATSPSLPSASTTLSPALSTPVSVPLPTMELSSKSLIPPSTSRASGTHNSKSIVKRGLGVGLDPQAQLYLYFGMMEFLIGAGLWVEGQVSGWRCLAGVGYLVVFDALGVGVGMVMIGQEEGEGKGLRRPYGIARLIALLSFAQSLFLLFAAVYIAKESIETVLLGQAAHDGNTSGGHGHGHGHGHGGDEERPFPYLLLTLAAVGAVFSSGALSNHSQLVDAVGTLFLPSSWIRSTLFNRFKHSLRNPFSFTVVFGSLSVLLGSLAVPSSSLHALDSTLSLLLTILTASLAYPTTVTFARVLLQTAPEPTRPQMLQLRKAIKDLKNDRRILGIGLTRVWAVGACSSEESSILQQISEKRSHRNDSISSNFTSPPDTPALSNPASPEACSPTTNTFGLRFESLSHTYPSLFARRKSSIDQSNGANKEGDGLKYCSASRGIGTKLVVTLNVHVDEGVSERDILEVTKEVWKRISGAIDGVVTAGKGGEVCVGVKRGWEGLEL